MVEPASITYNLMTPGKLFTHISVTKLRNLVMAEWQWCSVAGKATGIPAICNGD